jgi:hypothetical protein
VRAFAIAITVVLFAGCRDAVHDDAVDALGPEQEGVEQGPLHRPGQPCTVCHGGDGPGDPRLELAGTVFAFADSSEPLPGALVHVVDSRGRRSAVGSNLAGNFYWLEGELPLEFPIWTSIELCGRVVEMETPIFRATSCASCHRTASSSTVAQIYFAKTPEELCP